MTAETRKVQKTGAATYTVSLPKAWVRKHSVKVGDTLHLMEGKDGALSVGVHDLEAAPTQRAVDIDTLGEEELVRKLLAEYLLGADVIKLRSAKGISGRKRNLIIEQLKRLMSFEIVEEDANTVVVQDFFSAEHLSIQKALKRAFAITSLMLRDMARVIESGDRATVNNIRELENEVDRINFLVMRQLGKALRNSAALKSLELETDDVLSFAFVVRDIENITDHITALASHTLEFRPKELKPALLANLKELNRHLIDAFATTTKAVFSRDFRLANKAFDERKAIVEKGTKISRQISELSTPTALVADAVFSNMLSIAGHISAIAEVAIDRS